MTLETAVLAQRAPSPEAIAAFCRHWRVRELSLFGSAVRNDFGPASDVDVLVSFNADSHPSLFDLVAMRDELTTLFGRDVDLVELDGLRNPFRRLSILTQRRVLYAA